MLRTVIVLMLLLVAFGGAGGWAANDELNFGDFPGAKYVACESADVCIFTLSSLPAVIGWNVPVRLRGIQVPDPKGACPREKELAVQTLTVVQRALGNITVSPEKQKRHLIVLRGVKRDKTFGLVADIEVEGTDLGTMLVESGLAARTDANSAKTDFCNPPSGSGKGPNARNSEDSDRQSPLWMRPAGQR